MEEGKVGQKQPVGDSELLEQLRNNRSPKRRSAAKKLRKRPIDGAGPALRNALQEEVKDLRTWETQYFMIMALGACDDVDSIELLRSLETAELELMPQVALGDVITWLESLLNGRVDSLERWIQSDRKHLVEGGFRALWKHRIIPEDESISCFIRYSKQLGNERPRFWLVSASPAWPDELTLPFLYWVLEQSDKESTIEAATAALNHRYIDWDPL